jgi:hypothetical protein
LPDAHQASELAGDVVVAALREDALGHSQPPLLLGVLGLCRERAPQRLDPAPGPAAPGHVPLQ